MNLSEEWLELINSPLLDKVGVYRDTIFRLQKSEINKSRAGGRTRGLEFDESTSGIIDTGR